jgi:hypothetical protein
MWIENSTYRCDIIEELSKKSDDVVHVLVAFHEPQSLAPRQFSDDVESKELQPLAEVAALTRTRKHVVRLVEPVRQG